MSSLKFYFVEVLDALRVTLVLRGDYAKAFTACRKHRIDLNVLVEHNREAFLERLPSFIEQVSDVDYINLFLTNLGYAHPIYLFISELTWRHDQSRQATR